MHDRPQLMLNNSPLIDPQHTHTCWMELTHKRAHAYSTHARRLYFIYDNSNTRKTPQGERLRTRLHVWIASVSWVACLHIWSWCLYLHTYDVWHHRCLMSYGFMTTICPYMGIATYGLNPLRPTVIYLQHFYFIKKKVKIISFCLPPPH